MIKQNKRDYEFDREQGKVHGMLWRQKKARRDDVINKNKIFLKRERENHQCIAEKLRDDIGQTLQQKGRKKCKKGSQVKRQIECSEED